MFISFNPPFIQGEQAYDSSGTRVIPLINGTGIIVPPGQPPRIWRPTRLTPDGNIIPPALQQRLHDVFRPTLG